MIEIEQRYKIHDTTQLLKALSKVGVTVERKEHIIDQWFAPLSVQSHALQQQWFDGDHGLAYRIRRIEQPDESFTVKVETKQLTSDNNHNTFHETTLGITDYNEAQKFLKAKDYWNWLTIDKTRTIFTSLDSELDIILDEIAGIAKKIGVGAALEVEYQGNADRETALFKINAFMASLELPKLELFEKSFTVSAMEALAKFK